MIKFSSITLLVIIFNSIKLINGVSVTNERYRLNYHIMAPAGWINDPNGFSYYNGEYHVFYQYNPDDATHENMHWGHVKSSDLVHWEHLSIALYPDQQYDIDGVFSGSGIVYNGSLVLMYTGNVNQTNGTFFSSQSQALAVSSDGENFTKYVNNPVIAFPPEDGGNHFRDPKVWQYNNTFYVVLGNQNNLTQGRAVIYSSSNLYNWTYVGVLAESTGNFGFMWECPDFFELSNRNVLLLSPQGINASGDDYNNLYQTGYFIGSYNYLTNNFSHDGVFIELDHGHDFYAAQTMEAPDGRRIMIAWMDMWDSDYLEQEDGWVGALTIPRELTLSSSQKILQNPVQESTDLRTSTLLNTTINVQGTSKLLDANSSEILISATFNDSVTQVGIQIDIGNNTNVLAYFNKSSSKFVLDRGDNDPRRTSINVTSANNSQTLEMRIFLDKSSIELFLGDGEITFSSRIYPSSTPAVYALSNGTVTEMEVVAYELENIWSDPPQIITKPRNQHVKAGGVAAFFCSARADPPPIIQWRKNGKKLSSVQPRYQVNEFAIGESLLRIEPVRANRDEAVYECLAENGVGDAVSADAILTVYDVDNLPEGFPHITQPPAANKVVEITHTAVLTCGAIGNPPPKINWFRNMIPLNVTNNSRISIRDDTGILKIKNSEEKDQGRYECSAENTVGTEFSKPALLYVKVRRVPPQITRPPPPINEVAFGSDLNLTCVAAGSPMPFVKWRKGNGEEVGSDQLQPIGVNTLVLTNIHESANYTCIANSSLGLAEAVAQVKVQSLPIQPSKVQVSEITATSVRLSWSYNGTEDVQYYVIQFKPRYANQAFSEISGIITMYYSVRNLSPYTEYEMFVSAVNNIGRGPPSATVTVVTGETAGSAAGIEMDTVPHNVQVRPLSSSTIVIQWEEPDIPSGQITGYKVYFTTNPNVPVAQWRSQMVDNNQLTTISELTPHTIYTIKVQAFTYDGPGPLSLPVNVKTQQGVPSQPTNIRVVEANVTALSLRWGKPTYSSEDLLTYELYWNDTYANERHTRQLSPIEKYILLDLHPNTLYNVWIAAKSSRGEGATSPPIAARTKEYIPGEPQDLKVISINSTALTITWRPSISKFPESIIQGYLVFIQETNNEDLQVEQPTVFQMLKPSIFEFNVTELQPDTSYSIQVAALARGINGNRTDPYVIKTPGGVPSKPTLFVSSMEQDSKIDVELEWSRPISTYGELLGYRIRYGIKGKPLIESFIKGQNISRYQITDLQKGEKYEFKISGQNHIGFGQEFISIIDMPEGLPSGPPTNVSYTFQTPDIVCFSWHPPSQKHRNGKITFFEVQFHKKSDRNNIISRNVSTSRAVFTNLDENSEYVFHVRAYTSKGAGPFCEKVSLETEDVGRAPMNVRVVATSDSSVEVWWENMPSRKRILGYQIFYTMVAVEDLDEWQQTSVGLTESANIINLEKYAQYAVAVAARLEQGFGRLSEKITVKVKPEDVPLNLRAHDVTTHSMTLSWSPPIKLNPIHFKICFDAVKEFVDSQGITQTQIIPKVEKIVEYNARFHTINDLSPFTTYNVNVSAVPSDGSYRPPAKITVTTQMAAPQAMVQPDFYGVENGEEIQVILPQASEEYGPISHYFLIVVPENSALNYKNPDQFLTDSIIEQTKLEHKNLPYVAAKFPQRNIPYTFHLGTGEKFGGFVNRRLEPGKKYRIFVRAVVDTPQKHLYTSSPFSVYLALNMREVPPGDPPLRPNPKVPTDTDVKVSSHRKEAGIFWIVGPLIAVITVSIFFVFIFILRKRRQPCKTPDPSLQHKSLFPNNLKNGTVPTDPVELRRQNFQTPAMASHPPISISEFSEHVEHLKANENMKFSQEYESIEPGQQFTWEHSNMDVNKSKNRYANVIAYDHSRVVLSLENGMLGTDYINANYCDGYRKPNAYIATQGPLQETFNDFWRMCWEVKTSTIVMMTKLEERTRIKCDRYWPERDSETYGSITVTMTDFQQLAYHCIRTFQIAKRGYSDEREIKQLQFTSWPDHGVPDHPASFIQFVKRVRSINPPGTGPIVVHCSAGVGRTGCYIVIDSMLERIKHEKSIDIYGHVTCLRAQRNYMVQTEEQYIFIHDALLEAVICGETEVPARELHSHVQRLLALRPGESVTEMLIEFRNLGYFKIDSLKINAANLPCNKHKNRLIHILPYENTRVFLTSLPNVEGSDYINANFVDSYSCRKAYIATQEPMLETVNDFWRMLWEHNSTIIVMLTKLAEIGRDKSHQYWPSDRSIRYHCLVVDPIAEYNMPQYILREFKITDARDGVFRTIRQFQFTEWPEEGVPKSGDGFIDFIGQVHKTKGQFGQDGPITIHCSAGVGRTGVFITLSIVIERMQCEGVVDMFRTVRLLRTQRPAMVQTEDQYKFCYQAALEYLGSFDHYSNGLL